MANSKQQARAKAHAREAAKRRHTAHRQARAQAEAARKTAGRPAILKDVATGETYHFDGYDLSGLRGWLDWNYGDGAGDPYHEQMLEELERGITVGDVSPDAADYFDLDIQDAEEEDEDLRFYAARTRARKGKTMTARKNARRAAELRRRAAQAQMRADALRRLAEDLDGDGVDDDGILDDPIEDEEPPVTARRKAPRRQRAARRVQAGFPATITDEAGTAGSFEYDGDNDDELYEWLVRQFGDGIDEDVIEDFVTAIRNNEYTDLDQYLGLKVRRASRQPARRKTVRSASVKRQADLERMARRVAELEDAVKELADRTDAAPIVDEGKEADNVKTDDLDDPGAPSFDEDTVDAVLDEPTALEDAEAHHGDETKAAGRGVRPVKMASRGASASSVEMSLI